MSKFWSALVSELQPYVPGEQPKMANLVKLNTNENPFGPSPKVIAAIQSELNDNLRLYPDPEGQALKEAIAAYHTDYGISSRQVFVGNGSDEVLAHIFQGLLKHDKPILFPDITYSFYPVYCGLYQIESDVIPLTESFEINPEDYKRPNGGIVFPNPNAPTGRYLGLEHVEDILKANPDSVVVVDEAYVDFGGETAISLVNQYPSLLVSQTLSKARSLAGLRVGFAVGNEELIEALNRVKDSFNSYPLDRLALAGAIAAFEDREWFEKCCGGVIEERERVTAELENLGFEVLPSKANFVFARHPSHEGADIAAKLREQGIIVRHFNKLRISDFLRITIGTSDQNSSLIKGLAFL
ncbi:MULTISPECIES: histidinol-phosphate transaminase [unclassified Marinobacter]|jgi:histidinol-phosphate aminotransferase|uniref:histidinol-phosphate transaminase n=1 Tax=unclassified Marinobacter TaxID=83889 RepID=UPI001268E59B|nr:MULTISPECIES: histidinol-phosphate transaminase [unclassified Marinobacter]QFS87814.1 Histidinol-phosphate aminotransferase [Marinobacter sp. THAF197a]QFT51599.1 Histidinol-phosphate aminotransferase [Marinobacter sp. THAF39]